MNQQSTLAQIAAIRPDPIPEDELDEMLARILTSPGNLLGDYSRDRRRGSSRRTLIVAGSGLAAASVAIAIITSMGGSNEPGGMVSTAYVVQATEHALADTSNDVVELQTSRTGGASTTMWIDPSTGASRADVYQDGALASTSYIVGGEQTVVWFASRTWEHSPGSTELIFGLSPQQIASDLSSGAFALVGTDTINGEDVLELTGAVGNDTEHLWVDSATYLPVRGDIVADGIDSQTQFIWSVASPQLSEEFDVTIPPGFHEVPNDPASSGRSGSGNTGSGRTGS